MSLTTSSRVSIFILFLAFVFPLSWTVEESSLEKILRNHGLPAGLFPRSVKSFKFDHQMGHLEVHLDRPCLAQYETRVFFDTIVKANLSFRQLQVFEGMSREELFLWLPVKDIFVVDPSSGVILIDIGFALKFLAFSRFDEPPICRSHLGLSFRMGGSKGTALEDQR
ncbi:hypothetical protein MtrunA17_Chr4g0048871 [Medicago truncatula]|uniref:Transmembrane protein, putative n=1 Tax=Medicago truncatula TaxID=3880 RepID=A0A072UP69_MEDTR|nr:uncharacterized protein LOC25493243 [Medicago truncatula]KEH31171.1 transmembrane protein, putative [Medicago truncatula]RHN62569.1 hypothetical protein MtrunA17_Chr4g0048871 [Medicago truncatula]